MKVTLVIYAMGSGGAERVMSILANYWAAHNWEVTLLTLVSQAESPFYHLDSRIKINQLGISGNSSNVLEAITNSWRRIQALRAAIIASQADVVISFMDTGNVLTILACRNSNIPVIVSEHMYPATTTANKIWQLLMKLTYKNADLVTVLTQNAVPFFPPTKGYRTIVMPNPVLTPSKNIIQNKLFQNPSLIAIGRLNPAKGFDILMQAFYQIHKKYPDWHLTILGEGENRSELEELRSQLQLNEVIHMPGQVHNVNDRLRQADIFVMSSRFEGFPMALCEAMACGLPVISTDCLSGPREIIENGVNGILVETEDVNALATGLEQLISNPQKRDQLSQAAPGILEKFGLEKVMKLWEDAIKQVIDCRNRNQVK
jgi:GalNAc-alpha-(1->4)-GalNAc-alpha-(1->3)-diNAcBac-PP-undecaprenol alpha-1,4-N-acetyl-D-galactosaminyltransferase